MPVDHLITGLRGSVRTRNHFQSFLHPTQAEFLHITGVDGIGNTEVLSCRDVRRSRHRDMLGSYMHLVAQHHQQQYDIPTYFFHINFLFLIFVPILNVSTKTVFLPILVVGFSARLAHRLLQLSLGGLFLLNRGIEELFGVIAAHLVLILLVLVAVVILILIVLHKSSPHFRRLSMVLSLLFLF